jgi:hypothetical protein
MSHMKNRDMNRPRREDRIVQAQIRQEAYDKLTVEQKLAMLPVMGSAKQRARLAKALRSIAREIVEGVMALDPNAPVPAILKEKKGVKAKRQARKDKRGA